MNENKPGKLVMLKGLPRSGKSTYAKDFVKTSGNWYRVNKDDLRTMLHDNKWSPHNEKITMKAQMLIVRGLLESGKNVLVDDTNLGDSHRERWSNLAKELGANFETKEFTADVDELVRRDELASDSRGRDVIEKMALQYRYLDYAPGEIVVCDIDGTIADCEHRKHHLHGHDAKNENCKWAKSWKEENSLKCDMYCKHPEHKCDCNKKDWNAFFNDMDKDTIIMDTAKFLAEMHHLERKKIIFVSARPEKYRKMTEDWLAKHNILPVRSSAYQFSSAVNIPYEALLLRQDGDSRDDTITKKQILDLYLDKKWIHIVVDDRPSVIRMWRENDLEVMDVGKGVEF